MKKKTLLSSILVMALCLSIIAGSTFALFTDETKLNIAVTSGNVEVSANLTIVNTWSAVASDTFEDKYLVDEYDHTYNHEVQPNYTFLNEGFAEIDSDGKLVVNKITPGDKVVAKINVQNTGDVAMIYRYKIVSNNSNLASGMVLTTDVDAANETIYEAANTYVSAWSDVIPVDPTGTANYEHVFALELPVYAGDEYQSEKETQPHGKSNTTQSVSYTITVEAVQGNAAMFDDAVVDVAINTEFNAATGKTETKEETVITSNGISAEIPAGTSITGGATTATLSVTEDASSTGNFNFTATGAQTTGFDISIPEVAADNTTPITITLEALLAKNLNGVMLYHKDVPMTAVASAAAVDADGEFYYDAATGNVTLATASFSNFTAVVLNSIEVDTEAELVDAINAGANAVLTGNITLTKTLAIKKNVVIDLNGYTISNTSASPMLQSYERLNPDVIITSSKSGAKINAGDNSVLLGYGSTSIYNVEINVGTLKSSGVFKVYGDLTLGKGTVVNVDFLGTSLISCEGKITVVLDGAKINAANFRVNAGAIISCNTATVLEIKNANVNVVLDTTYTSYFVTRADKTTIADDCTFNVTDANGATYHIEYKPDANVGAKYIWVKN